VIAAIGTIAGAVLLAASILFAAKRFRRERLTVEQEQANSYAVAAHGSQWSNITTEPELPEYPDLDDVPQDLILRHIREVA
jgi:hypothetical protein